METGTIPAQLLASGGHGGRVDALAAALRAAGDLGAACRVVTEHGLQLWRDATGRAQQAAPDLDDRPLYWARLAQAGLLERWEPESSWLTDEGRARLLLALERASRGMEGGLSSQPARARVLITGFDPFGLADASTPNAIARGNPSGSAALALDGRVISSGGSRAEIKAAIFPVRFADFDAGLVERFLSPLLNASPPPDLIMTISQGRSQEFEVEQWAGRRRSASAPDNLGRPGGGTDLLPFAPPGLGDGPEFIETALPAAALRRALGRDGPLPEETEVTEIPAGAARPVHRAGGPTPGSTSVRGSGGGYLSNEIFYRASLLRLQRGLAIPLGHLHTPYLPPPDLGLSDARFEERRAAIVATIERLLLAILPELGPTRGLRA